MMRPEQLTEIQLDALREVGSIGASHAATALSQMLGHAVELSVPTLELVSFHEVASAFGGPERLVGAVHCRLIGEIRGGIMFVVSRDSSLALMDLLHSRPSGTTSSFGVEEEALFTHVGGILVAAYVAAIARLADVHVLPSQAAFALDMAGAILEAAVSEIGDKVDSAMLVRARFTGEGSDVEGVVFFLPEPESLEVLLGRLGVV